VSWTVIAMWRGIGKGRMPIANQHRPESEAKKLALGLALTSAILCHRMASIVAGATFGESDGARQNPLRSKGFGIDCHRFSAEGTGFEPATGRAGI
jgi:hypothetical protein